MKDRVFLDYKLSKKQFEDSLSYYGDCIFELKSSVIAISPAPFLKGIDTESMVLFCYKQSFLWLIIN